jgi:hypothetical protein
MAPMPCTLSLPKTLHPQELPHLPHPLLHLLHPPNKRRLAYGPSRTSVRLFCACNPNALAATLLRLNA